MLVTEDEMERRFADAGKAQALLEDIEEDEENVEEIVPTLPDIVEDEEDELFGATTEFVQPESAIKAAYAAEKAKKSSGESTAIATEEIIMVPEEEIHDAEIIKKRRMSVFSRLKSLLRDGEPENTEPEVEEIPVPEFTYTPEVEEEDLEGATTEFISPFTSERDAIAASEMQSTEIFDSVFISNKQQIFINF